MQWNENFENLIEKVLCEEKEIYILGDFNRDLLNTNTKKPWLDFMEQFSLFQKVTEPIRETNNPKTLIDHIYCNTPSNIPSVVVPKIGISDHYPIFLNRKINFYAPKTEHFSIKYRSFKNFNKAVFNEDMSSVLWDIIKAFDDPDETLESWSDLLAHLSRRLTR